MARKYVSDELWERIEALLPKREPPGSKGGRPPVPDRVALEGILFVLKTGIPWEDLPQQFGCCGMTCWRRLRDWNEAGVWKRLHELLLSELRAADVGRPVRESLYSGTAIQVTTKRQFSEVTRTPSRAAVGSRSV
jgi:transposase